MKNLHEIEQTLQESSRDLLSGGSNPELKAALLGAIQNISDAYVIDWIPEQGSDIYTVIIPPDKRVVVEVPRRGVEQHQQEATIEIHEYNDTLNTKGLSREKRNKLSAVKNLMARRRAGNATPIPSISPPPPA